MDEAIITSGPIVGNPYTIKIVIDRKDMKGMLGVEMVITNAESEKQEQKLRRVLDFKLEKEEGSKLYFDLTTTPDEAGMERIAFRVYPKNPDLPHRQDFAYIRWVQK